MENQLPKEKKKNKILWCLVPCCSCLVLLAVVAVGALGYFGFIPGLSSLMAADKPKDLGITYTEADYNSGIKKLGINFVEISVADPIGNIVKEIARHIVKNSFTSEEFTALANKRAEWGSLPIKNTQVRINKDDTFEVSGVLKIDLIIDYLRKLGVSEADITKAMEAVKLPMKDMPFYIKAAGSIMNNKVAVDFQNFEVSRFPIPINIIKQYTDDLNALFSNVVEKDFKANINSMILKDGQIVLDGMVPNEERIFVSKGIYTGK